MLFALGTDEFFHMAFSSLLSKIHQCRDQGRVGRSSALPLIRPVLSAS